jgi:hypothetical protein
MEGPALRPICALVCLLLAAMGARAGDSGRMVSKRIASDFTLTADPNWKDWKAAVPVFAGNNALGEPTPGHRTEFRSLWTGRNLYFLFVCPYEHLYLKPDPSTTKETFELWQWDVAEVFVGADFQNIRRYREFQVSPQGEWIDLDIDRDTMDARRASQWNSGFQVAARLDRTARIWYGAMRIPIASIDSRPPKAGNEMRINLYRIQGPPPDRRFIAWQPTGQKWHHVPEAFGTLVLGE